VVHKKKNATFVNVTLEQNGVIGYRKCISLRSLL